MCGVCVRLCHSGMWYVCVCVCGVWCDMKCVVRVCVCVGLCGVYGMI